MILVHNSSNHENVLLADYSRQRMTLETIHHLLRFQAARRVTEKIRDLSWGRLAPGWKLRGNNHYSGGGTNTFTATNFKPMTAGGGGGGGGIIVNNDDIRKFFGHVGTNPYQTYRYIEAIRHIIQQKQQQTQYEVRVNVCETGFNGGHSAMLFLSFLDLENGIKVHYYGWDLKEVGSSLPTAEKMEREFGDHFHIVWGDSKKTLKNANETMSGQKCDLIVVDGEHSRNGVVNDLQNLLVVAEKGAIVFGDDCAPYKGTVPKSEEMLDGWNSFVTAGDLISVAMYRNPELGSPGFVEGIVPGSNGEYILGL